MTAGEADGSETDDAGRPLSAYLGVAGIASLCCIGAGTVVGGAAVAGGASTVTAAAGGANVAGSVISGLVTLATVAVVGLAARWQIRR